MECYMMSQPRAEALASALRHRYGRKAKALDAGTVRVHCLAAAEAATDPIDQDWLESGPLDEVVDWIDLEKLLSGRP